MIPCFASFLEVSIFLQLLFRLQIFLNKIVFKMVVNGRKIIKIDGKITSECDFSIIYEVFLIKSMSLISGIAYGHFPETLWGIACM